MIRRIGAALALCVGLGGHAAMAGCGAVPDACELAGGDYHVALPPDASGAPMVLFLHGAGGTGETAMRNTGMIDRFLDRGYAVIAPTGSRRFRQGQGRVWSFYPGRRDRDETAFLKSVVADAADRFGTDSARVLMTGFSAGGFMVYYLACEAPATFTAYASVSGGFWRPHPEGCSGPARLFHTHGWTDNVVPLEGRFLGGGRFQQGDIFAGLEIWRQANGCEDNRPDRFSATGPFLRRKWLRCADGSALEMALHPGGHMVPAGWADMVIDWFEALDEVGG